MKTILKNSLNRLIINKIRFQTGMVDKRTLEKYEREAKEQNRESWYLSWALDTNLEERAKGKTVEVGRAFFETDKKHFIILDWIFRI
jgi:peptide chain release factor subunit 3